MLPHQPFINNQPHFPPVNQQQSTHTYEEVKNYYETRFVQDTVDINIETKCQRQSTENVNWSINVISKSQKIMKVTFHLHPTFQPNQVDVTQSPFQLARSGWGSFDLKIEIWFLHDGSLNVQRSYSVAHYLDIDISQSNRLVKVPVLRQLRVSEYLHLEIGHKCEKMENDNFNQKKFNYTLIINPKTKNKPNNIKITFPRQMNEEEITVKEFPFQIQKISDGTPFEISIKVNIVTPYMKSLSLVHRLAFDKPFSSFLYFMPLPDKFEDLLLDESLRNKVNYYNTLSSTVEFIKNVFEKDEKEKFHQAVNYYGLYLKQRQSLDIELFNYVKSMSLSKYVVKNRSLLTVENWIEKDWIPFIQGTKNFDQIKNSITRQSPGVVSTKIFTENFCKALVEEMDKLKHEVPISDLNRKGVDLLSIGFKPFFDKLQYLITKLAKTQHPMIKYMECKQAYVLKYDPKKEHSHEIHVDESDLTLNLCMGKVFEGGDLKTVPKLFDQPFTNYPAKKTKFLEEFLTFEEKEKADNCYSHKQLPGTLLFHSGSLSHLCDPVTNGYRYNLIIWFNATFDLSDMMSKLPLDISINIFSFLSFKDIRSVALSCKKFSVFTKSEKLWRIMFFKKYDSNQRDLLSESENKLNFLEKCKLLKSPNFVYTRPIQNFQPTYNFNQSRMQPPPMRMPHPMRHIPYNNPHVMRHIPHHNPMMRHMPPPMKMPHVMRHIPHHNPHVMRHIPHHNPMMRHMPPPMRMPHPMRHVPHHNPQPMRMLHPMRQPQRMQQPIGIPSSPLMREMEEVKPPICWIF